MPGKAAAPWRRRAPLGPVVALAAYLVLFPAIFVLGPLAGLLLVSGPVTLRERWWVAAALIWMVVAFLHPGGIATQVVLAWGVLVTGAFLGLAIWRPRPWVTVALQASTVAWLALTVIAWGLGLRWSEVRLAVAHDGWEMCRQLFGDTGLPSMVSPQRAASIAGYRDALSEGVAVVAGLYPALLVLTGLLGLGLAWNWYHRISSKPIGPTPAGFAAFRFNDQLIWGVVAALGLMILPVPDPGTSVGANLALVLGGLYAARGAAVVWTSMAAVPGAFLLALGLGMMVLLPIALGGLVSLGLADTWLDFRRRFAPSH